mmetsp:Transcript_2610/g.6743  ORF Transcript_2610/g.6743 Transcript_2610/m.6743 type:complete len:423 (+) Transcript_2610:2740-4008(+)
MLRGAPRLPRLRHDGDDLEHRVVPARRREPDPGRRSDVLLAALRRHGLLPLRARRDDVSDKRVRGGRVQVHGLHHLVRWAHGQSGRVHRDHGAARAEDCAAGPESEGEVPGVRRDPGRGHRGGPADERHAAIHVERAHVREEHRLRPRGGSGGAEQPGQPLHRGRVRLHRQDGRLRHDGPLALPGLAGSARPHDQAERAAAAHDLQVPAQHRPGVCHRVHRYHDRHGRSRAAQRRPHVRAALGVHGHAARDRGRRLDRGRPAALVRVRLLRHPAERDHGQGAAQHLAAGRHPAEGAHPSRRPGREQHDPDLRRREHTVRRRHDVSHGSAGAESGARQHDGGRQQPPRRRGGSGRCRAAGRAEQRAVHRSRRHEHAEQHPRPHGGVHGGGRRPDAVAGKHPQRDDQQRRGRRRIHVRAHHGRC